MGIVSSAEIASFLRTQLIGENIDVDTVSTLNKPIKGSVVFSKNKLTSFPISVGFIVLCPIGTTVDLAILPKGVALIEVSNPRLAYAKVVAKYFIERKEPMIHPSAIISAKANVHKTACVGANTFIDDGVVIGKHTIINNNVVLAQNVIIGNNCYIKSGAVIGEDGFGFDFEENGKPVRIPHLGNVVIGNNVEVGAKVTIARGTIGSTTINNNVKFDDQVHVGHNCCIGENTIITACAELSGSVTIGENCWIGPNSSIIQKVNIGNKVTIGIGSIITKDIEDNKKIMALEGLDLRSLLKVKKRIEYGK